MENNLVRKTLMRLRFDLNNLFLYRLCSREALDVIISCKKGTTNVGTPIPVVIEGGDQDRAT